LTNNNLKLSELWTGKLEGKDAYFDSSDGNDSFDTYLIPENVVLSRLKSRETQFILGARGTGKTSMLRFLANSIANDGGTVKFILFKTDITEAKKIELSKNVWYGQISAEKFEISQDFKDAWTWFLLHHIAKTIF